VSSEINVWNREEQNQIEKETKEGNSATK